MSKLYLGEEEITVGGGGNFDNYYTKEEVDAQHKTIYDEVEAQSEVLSNTLVSLKTVEQSVVKLASKMDSDMSDVMQNVENIESVKADKSSVYTKDEVDNEIKSSHEVIAQSLSSIDERVKTIEETPAYDDTELSNRVSALESIDHSKYLTEHQSLAGYYTKTQVDDIVGNIDTALQNIING